MPERIPVAMNQKVVTAEMIASTTGWITVASGAPCFDHDPDNSERLANLIARGRRLAVGQANRPRLVIKWRPDLWAPHTSVAPPPGFRGEWLVRIADVTRALEIFDEWRDAGWTWVGSDHLRLDAWTPYMDSLPQLYAHGDLERKRLRIFGAVCDLTNADYRAWAVDSAIRYARLFSVDAFIMDAKIGWHCAGSPARSTPTIHPQAGGVVWESPHAPGEFEAGYAALLRELSDVDIRPVLITRPGRPEDGADLWAWMPEDVRDLPLGEFTE